MSKEKSIFTKRKIVILAVVAFVAFAGFFVIQAVRANSDYICTIYEDDNGECTDGVWSAWEMLPGSDVVNGCVTTKAQKKTYTGRYFISRTIKYFANSRIGCFAGGTAETISELTGRYFDEATTTVESAYNICQYDRTRTVQYDYCNNDSNTVDENGGSNNSGDSSAVVTIGGETDSGLNIDTSVTHNSTSTDELSITRVMLHADPTLVALGQTSELTWSSINQIADCTIEGKNTHGDLVDNIGDVISHGSTTTAPILGATEYTLQCTDARAGHAGIPLRPSKVIIRNIPTTCEGGQENCGGIDAI